MNVNVELEGYQSTTRKCLLESRVGMTGPHLCAVVYVSGFFAVPNFVHAFL